MYQLKSQSDWSRLALFQSLAYSGNLEIIFTSPPDWLGLGMCFEKKIKVLKKNIFSFITETNRIFTLATGFYQDSREEH